MSTSPCILCALNHKPVVLKLSVLYIPTKTKRAHGTVKYYVDGVKLSIHESLDNDSENVLFTTHDAVMREKDLSTFEEYVL
jgi:hypothetical protein